PCVFQLRPPVLIAALADLEQLPVVGSRLRFVAGGFGGARRPVDGTEPVRLFFEAGLELFQRVRRLLCFKQHLAKQLVGRRQRAGMAAAAHPPASPAGPATIPGMLGMAPRPPTAAGARARIGSRPSRIAFAARSCAVCRYAYIS